MSTAPLKHLRIIANAGSGKTTRLTTRFLELLGRGVPVERIIALTFTRKAAGEFLDKIFHRLLEGSDSETAARELARQTGVAEFSQATCRLFLRQLVEKLPRVSLGTLDSFFGRIVRSFPFECGLAGDFVVLDEHLQTRTRREVFGEIFRRYASSEKDFAEFLDLLRRQSRNRQQRSVSAILDHIVEDLHERFLQTPSDRPWGEARTIWPDGSPLLAPADLPALATELQAAIFARHVDMEEKYRDIWEERFTEIRSLRPGHPLPERVVKFALKALDPTEAKEAGVFILKLGNKQFKLPDTLRDLTARLGYAILRGEILGRLERSRALFDLLAQFEAAYHQTVRDAGRLTFLDITGLLAAAGGAGWGGKSVTRIDRREIDFRLDSTYDHWLLDEFQDTSRLQWQALRDLVDEVIQSESGQRSFFYVGDAKQAIYGWRGGDPRLFDEVADFYNASGTERIDTSEQLATSYRSVPEIITAVNMLFAPDNLQKSSHDMELPAQTLVRWASAWRDHSSYSETPDRGCVFWKTFEPEEKAKDFLDQQTASLLQEIQPTAKGWTCAVLVSTNARIASVINALRDAGLTARSEGRFQPCVDNDLGVTILALFRVLAHPADTFSLRHVQMTPFSVLLGEKVHAFRESAFRLLGATGFAATVQQWMREADVQLGPFSLSRAQDFLEMAAEFDQAFGGKAGVDDFIQYAENFSARENPDAGAIRVMTIHAAKGLDFDMVVLPDLEGTPLATRRDKSVCLHAGDDSEIEWGLELPSRPICEADATLRGAYEDDLAEDCYENLCRYYVATTRARRGLYLLSTRQGETTKRKDFNRLLHDTLRRHEGEFVLGNPHWHEEKPVLAVPAVMEISGEFALAKKAALLVPDAPSREGGFLRDASFIFSGDTSKELGSEVHEILACISWIEEGKPSFEKFSPAAGKVVSSFLSTQEAHEIFARPAGEFALWREKAFEVLFEDKWISGVFDRVVIFPDASGTPQSAQIIDFKTDREALGTRHDTQMARYRRSLSILTGLPEESITVRLVPVVAYGND